MRAPGVVGALLLAGCGSFGEAAPPDGGGAAQDATAPADAADGGTDAASAACVYCEDFSSRQGVDELGGIVARVAAVHTLVGAVGTPERRLRVEGQPYATSARLDGQLIFLLPGPPPPRHRYEATITFEQLSNVDVMALAYEVGGEQRHFVYVAVEGGELRLSEFEPGVVDSQEPAGAVVQGGTYRLALEVSTSGQASLRVDDREPVTVEVTIPAGSASFSVQYGPFSLRDRTAVALEYDDIRVVRVTSP